METSNHMNSKKCLVIVPVDEENEIGKPQVSHLFMNDNYCALSDLSQIYHLINNGNLQIILISQGVRPEIENFVVTLSELTRKSLIIYKHLEADIRKKSHIHSSDKRIKVSRSVNLTLRQREIAVQACRGLSNKQIAKIFNISHHTVKIHIYNIMKILSVANRVELALAFEVFSRASGQM